jgi:Ca2+-binding EF-hand superfamily protein
MPLLVVIAAALAFAAQADDEPPIRVKGYPGAPFISPMGEPFRARVASDVPFQRWFQQADRSGDGALTVDEMRADAERFFRTLDRNGDGEIDPNELAIYESEIAPEVQVNSKWKLPRQFGGQTTAGEAGDQGDQRRQRSERDVDGYQVHGLQGAARYGLLNIPEPVAGADADFNRATTLKEFESAAIQRFQLLDSKRAGHLTLADLETRLPTRPKKGEHSKSPGVEGDTRIGLPFPKGD